MPVFFFMSVVLRTRKRVRQKDLRFSGNGQKNAQFKKNTMIQRGFHNKLILKMIINQATQDWQNAARNAESVIKAHH